MALDLYQVWKSGPTKFYDFLKVLSRTQNETNHVFIFSNLYFRIVLFATFKKPFYTLTKFVEIHSWNFMSLVSNEAYGHSFFTIFLVFKNNCLYRIKWRFCKPHTKFYWELKWRPNDKTDKRDLYICFELDLDQN